MKPSQTRNVKKCASIRNNSVIVYPQQSPFDPSEAYPELESSHISGEPNQVYAQLRACFMDMQMDQPRMGTAEWSPFSDFILPGNTVVVKPNLVLNTANPAIQSCTTTHPSLIRVVVDYAWKALRGNGRIIVGDASAAEANFEEIVQRTGIREMIETLQQRGVAVELRDFRAVKVTTENGIWTGEQHTDSVEQGQIVDLAENSLFSIQAERYKNATLHGAGYDIDETNRHHHDLVQEYCVSQTILQADVVISMPKMKTHRKAGFTCCLKNLVGINADKNYLPHFAMGSANVGGDEMPAIPLLNTVLMSTYNFLRRYVISCTWQWLGAPAASLLRKLKNRVDPAPQPRNEDKGQTPAQDTDTDLAKWLHNKLSGQSVAAGAWAGNETICCMILDLNRIFLCCDRNGCLKDKTDRKIFYVADGIESGMGNGPTHPTPVQVGAVAAGYNGLAIDIALLNLFGIDEDSITLYKRAKTHGFMRMDSEGDVLYNGHPISRNDRFECELIPPEGWDYRKL